LGAAVGGVADRLWHEGTSIPGHYAMIGMGALLAATARAPLTAIFLVFELTGSSSTAVLDSRGLRLRGGRELAAFDSVTAEQAMRPGFEGVPASTTAPALQALVSRSRASAYVVVDERDEMVGLLSLQDLCQRRVVTIFADETLSVAIERLDEHGFRQLPVVARENPRRVVGMPERAHILTAYRRSLVRRSEAAAADDSGSSS